MSNYEPTYKPTYKRFGDNFMPAIKHKDGSVEVLRGEPLPSIKRAMYYSRSEILYRLTQKIKQTLS